MVDVSLPNHVVSRRRDGRREVLLHRAVAVISDGKIEVKGARSTLFLPLAALAISAGVIAWMATAQGSGPLWLYVVALMALLIVVPVAVMGLVSTVAGAEVVVDARKGSATWQQGYLGMGIGTRELVPFHKIAWLEVTMEGAEGDRWRGEQDDLRQFALTLVKVSGKRLRIAHVPVPAYGQEDGMDRTLAVGQAIAALTGSEVRIPEGWELVEVDADTLAEATPEPTEVGPGESSAAPPAASPIRRRRRRS